jgi:hypothetical protein
MPWILYNNDIEPKIRLAYTSIGQILCEEYNGIPIDHVVTVEDIPLLPKKIKTKIEDIKVGSQLKTPISGEIGVVEEVKGVGGSRRVTIRMSDNIVLNYSAPTFNKNKKRKYMEHLGDLMHWYIWVDEGEDDVDSFDD